MNKDDTTTSPTLSPAPEKKLDFLNTYSSNIAEIESEAWERVRSEFLSNVNHDLRTPLNAVIGFAQIIESEMFGKIDNPQYLEYIKHIQDSGYELLTKIEQLCGASLNGEARISSEETAFPVAKNQKKHLAAVE